MSVMASWITSLTIVYSTVYSGFEQRKHQSSASLALVGEFTGDQWIPRTKASDAEIVSISLRHHGMNQRWFSSPTHICVTWPQCVDRIIQLTKAKWRHTTPCTLVYKIITADTPGAVTLLGINLIIKLNHFKDYIPQKAFAIVMTHTFLNLTHSNQSPTSW